ncbi:MAG: gliding motility-associated C-terminal domain-containing protein, partial [Prolixibacteraceae bacterium]|nr:gliding motility-associated C-terminal domain-containing protein [Prolixibacteraceae bacterium]
ARVMINIHKISDENHRPVAVDDAFYAVEKAITGNLMLNDYDPDGDELEILVEPVSGPYHGSIQMTNRFGEFIYIPNAGFEGTDQLVYALVETRTFEQYTSYATVYITSIAEERYITDVEIVKTGPAAILSGQTIEYQLQTNINGPSLSNDLVVSDTLFNALTNHRYSIDGGSTWRSWNVNSGFEQMMLYADSVLLIRADIPMRFEGTLVNTAWVSHDMGEKDDANNRSSIRTEVYQSVIADAGADIVLGACVTEYTLDGSESVGMSNLQYNWYPAELLDNPNSSKPVFITEPGETHEFTLIVSSTFGTFTDADTAYVTISVAEAPVAIAGEDIWPETIDPVEIDGSRSTGVGPLQYLWWTYDRDGNLVELATTPKMTVDRSGDYYLTITDIHGCTSTDLMHVGYPIDEFIAVDDTVITYQQLPVDIYVLRNDIIDDDDDYNLELLIITEGPKHGQLIQLPFDSMFTYIPDPYYTGFDTFTYVVSTLSYNDQAKVFIQVLERRAKVPEGFSPNGDGINDVLIIEHIELYEQNSLMVFNRWGNIVYQKEKYSNDDPWNGVANKGIRVGSGALPAGVYYYILDLGPDERIIDRYIPGNMYIATDNRR